ncbi:class A sortase [Lactococcus garvieae]|uniref:class A sortase n=1 Tax=Lactococcus garvieae TaxID=1363 RepID=UPI0038903FDF
MFLIPVLLVGVGLYFLASPYLARTLIEDKGAQLMEQAVVPHVEQKKKVVSTEENIISTTDIKPLTLEELLKNRMSDKGLDTGGLLSIPDVNMKLPILKGLNQDSLMYGAVGAKPNQKLGQGNFTLASHTIFNTMTGGIEKDLLFGNLVDAKVGQKIFVTDKATTYEYVIDKIRKVTAKQSDILEDHVNVKEITLYTCTTLEGDERLVVHGTLKATTPYEAQKSYFE